MFITKVSSDVRVRRPVGEKGELAGDAQRASPWSSKFWGNHLISDAHDWNNGILVVPIYYLAKPHQSERALQNQRGNMTLSDFAESAGQKVGYPSASGIRSTLISG